MKVEFRALNPEYSCYRPYFQYFVNVRGEIAVKMSILTEHIPCRCYLLVKTCFEPFGIPFGNNLLRTITLRRTGYSWKEEKIVWINKQGRKPCCQIVTPALSEKCDWHGFFMLPFGTPWHRTLFFEWLSGMERVNASAS